MAEATKGECRYCTRETDRVCARCEKRTCDHHLFSNKRDSKDPGRYCALCVKSL